MNYHKRITQLGVFLICLTLGTKVSFALDTLAVNPETNAGVRPENNLRPGQGNFIDNILVKNFNILSMRTRPMIWHSVYKTLQDRLSRGSLSVYTTWKNGFGRTPYIAGSHC